MVLSTLLRIHWSFMLLSGRLAGGEEPWRKWMLSTGWTGLSKPMKNPYTGEDLKPKNVNGLTLDW